MDAETEGRIGALPCWRSAVDVEPLTGGMTNHNFLVHDAAERFVVRLGQDLPQHGVMRCNELAAARAAHAAGLAPEVVYAQDGVMVTRYIESRTLVAADLRDPLRLNAIAGLLRRCHEEVALHLRGPTQMFRVFQVIRNYFAILDAIPDNLLAARLVGLKALATRLETGVGPAQIVFAHNDLLCGNFLDDGQRLWLIDWEYAGFNNPCSIWPTFRPTTSLRANLTPSCLPGTWVVCPALTKNAHWPVCGRPPCCARCCGAPCRITIRALTLTSRSTRRIGWCNSICGGRRLSGFGLGPRWACKGLHPALQRPAVNAIELRFA